MPYQKTKEGRLVNEITLGDGYPLSNDLQPLKIGGEASVVEISHPLPDGSDNGLFKVNGDLDITGTLKTKLSHDLIYDFDDEVNTLAQAKVDALIDSAPAALDTLNELAAALNDDASFSTTITNSLALKAPLAAPAFTGNATFDSTTLAIDATNNRVGIGTASPASLLHLQGSGNTGGLYFANSHDVVRQYFVDDNNDSRFFITYDATGGAEIELQADGDLILNGSNGDNVGIGTTSPTTTLDVDGTATFSGIVDFNSRVDINHTAFPQLRFSDDSGTDILNMGQSGEIFYFKTSDTNNDIRFRRSDNQDLLKLDMSTLRVGIGTDSPASALHVEEGDIRIDTASSATQALRFSEANTTKGQLQYRSGDEELNLITVDASGTAQKRITIKSEQDATAVGIGTTSPSATLDVAGDVNFTGDLTINSPESKLIFRGDDTSMNHEIESDGHLYITVDDDADDSNNFVQFRANASGTITNLMRIQDDGNVGIGTTSPTTTLDVNGTANFSDDVTLPDSKKIYLGNGNDLEIHHNGSNSVIKDNGTGDLSLQSNGAKVSMYDAANGAFMAKFNTGAGVELFHNGTEVFETTNTGVNIEGTVLYKHTAFSTAGPTDNVDVSDTTVLEVDTSGGSVTIGGFTGGVQGQILYVVKTTSDTYTLKLENNEGGGSQDIFSSDNSDISLVRIRGGVTLYCNGTSWFVLNK